MTRNNKIQITSIIFLISSSSIFFSLRVLEVHLILTVIATIVYMILFIIMLISYEFAGMVIKVLPNKENLANLDNLEEERIIPYPRLINSLNEEEEVDDLNTYINPDTIYGTKKPLS